MGKKIDTPSKKSHKKSIPRKIRDNIRKNFFLFVNYIGTIIPAAKVRLDIWLDNQLDKLYPKTYSLWQNNLGLHDSCLCKDIYTVLFWDGVFARLPINFQANDFWPDATDLFVEIGAGHGEITAHWVYLMREYPTLLKKAFLQNFRIYEQTEKIAEQNLLLKCAKYAIREAFTPVVVSFETRQRYFKHIRDLIISNQENAFAWTYIGKNLEQIDDLSIQAFYKRLLRKFCYPALVLKRDGFADTRFFAKESVTGFFVLFPDPWNKRRHYKRRKITAKWLKLALSKLRNQGFVFIITDHDDYAQHIKKEIQKVIDYFKQKDVQNKLLPYVYDLEVVENQHTNLAKIGLLPTHYYKKALRKYAKQHNHQDSKNFENGLNSLHSFLIRVNKKVVNRKFN